MAGAQGFGEDFFAEVMGQRSNPLREFLGSISPVASGSAYGHGFGSPSGAGVISPSVDFTQFISPYRFQASSLRTPPKEGQAPSTPSAVSTPLGRALEEAAKKKAQGGSAPSGGGAGTPGDGELDASVDPANPIFGRAAQIAQEEGIDPGVFQRLVAVESRGNANAYNRKSGAGGLTGLMPKTAASVGVTNVFDPEQALRGGAKYLRQMVDRYGGDYATAVAAYNAGPGTVDQYQGIPPFPDTQKYVRALTGQSKAPASQAEAMPQGSAVPTPPAGTRPLRGITTAQYGSEGLATGAADYICGPIAAQAFVRSQGRNPTLREALDLARGQGLIDAANGMHGVGATVQLIRALGGKATQGVVDKAQIIKELAEGRPVIVDTDAGSRGHYFVIEEYHPEDDTFDFGESARALRASQGRSRFTLDQISSLGFGAPHAAIYAR